jgi:hypothetical protein
MLPLGWNRPRTVGEVRPTVRMPADMPHPTAELKVRGCVSRESTMHVLLRLLLVPGVLLLAGASFALAESPLGLPDPVPPAVIGRPLDQLKPARPAQQAPAAAKPAPARPVAARPAAAAPVARPPAVSPKVPAHGVAQNAPATAHPAKKALDDRADPHMRLDDVGIGSHLARKPLAPGVFFGDRHRTAARRYYAEHPDTSAAAHWQIGESLPRGVSPAAVPKGLLAALPPLPPGYRYVELGGEVVMVASASKMVVDGISRDTR